VLVMGDYLQKAVLFMPYITMGARGSIVGWGTMLQTGRSRVQFPRRWDFSLDLSFQPHYGPVVDSAFNSNEYQDSSCE
jgi:hypothetical protein